MVNTSHLDYSAYLYSKAEGVARMNALGAQAQAFLFVIDFACRNWIVVPDHALNPEWIRFQFGARCNVPDAPKPSYQSFHFEAFPMPFSEYEKAFRTVVHAQLQGDSYLCNLTFPTPVTCSLKLPDLFHLADAKYKILLPEQFVCFSPETFVQITDGVISSFPMKGTIDAALPNAEAILLQDEKEQAEHATIVDFIRNDLSKVARQVRVEAWRYVERIHSPRKDLLQVSSRISGILPSNYAAQLGHIFEALLPAGSISGAPKTRTLEIIEAAEGHERGYYTGVCGYFDGKNLDSAVMIRFLEQRGQQLIYHSGGGITAYSQAQKEYQELIDKVYVPVPRNDPNSTRPVCQPKLA